MQTSQPLSDPDFIEAGPFGDWLAQARASLLGDAGSNVPCGDCTACCTSAYAVPLRPQDTRAIDAVPVRFLLSVPGSHTMMTARPDGSCPMLSTARCSIYSHRPQTCRDYDCRIFTAAGILAGAADREAINRRIRQWRFTYPTDADRRAQEAVLSASRFIQRSATRFPGRLSTSPTGIAVLALKVYSLFLDDDFQHQSEQDTLQAIIAADQAWGHSCGDSC